MHIERQIYVTYKIFWHQTHKSMNVFVDRCFLCSFKLSLLKLLYDDDWCTHILTILFIVSVYLTHQCKYNGIWWDCHQSERVSAIKPGLIHHFLHLKMPVPSQEYDSSCPFVFDAFCYLILPCDYGVQYFCDFTFWFLDFYTS